MGKITLATLPSKPENSSAGTLLFGDRIIDNAVAPFQVSFAKDFYDWLQYVLITERYNETTLLSLISYSLSGEDIFYINVKHFIWET